MPIQTRATYVILAALTIAGSVSAATAQTAVQRQFPHFAVVKQRILQRIARRQACVQSAMDPTALRACFPRMHRKANKGYMPTSPSHWVGVGD